ncbi:hypothetical protein D9611_003687 [Ephemerocybe angulata]|uniref:F-box domain-containing protein n=1 Tax=Ephemerocybe angulata TaxID=980116 RepID=A0A8H5B5E4_9AGAR|nr:hypothetical protein D9611_003687 [Tulosesus angulatus]
MSPPPIVYSCPPELWTNIFNLACLDGGYTARSLSQVSRRMRDVSFDHRYYSLKIESTSQLLKLEKNVEQSLVTKTKFLCVILPIDPREEAYPSDDSLLAKDPLECGSDDDYQPSVVDSDEESDTASFSSGLDSESSSVYEYETLEDPEAQELLLEIEDNRIDRRDNPNNSMFLTSLADIEDCHYPVFELQHRIYRAIRRLLEACSATLSVLSLYHDYPKPLLLHDAFLPPLPSLVRLTITMHNHVYWLPTSEEPMQVSPNFPSLLSLRLLGGGFPTFWTKRFLDALPKSYPVTIVTDVLRPCDWATRQPQLEVLPLHHVWVKSTLGIVATGKSVSPGEVVAQWLEDVSGEAPHSEEAPVKKVETKDGMFYFEDYVRFSVLGTLFRVPRRPFIQGSAHFDDRYGISARADTADRYGNPERADTADDTVDLQGVTPEDFRVFCRLLLLPSHDPLSSTSFKKDEWLKVLELATGWYFHQIRTLAISHLDATLSSNELITVGRRVYYPRWVLSGYLDLVKRPEGLSHQEGDQIGQTTRACLMRIRRKLERERGRERCGDLEEFLRGEIRSRFVIEITRLEDHEKDLL